jgi:hypothetical protein
MLRQKKAQVFSWTMFIEDLQFSYCYGVLGLKYLEYINQDQK